MFQTVSNCQTVATTGHVMHTSNRFARAQLLWGHSLW